MLKNIFIVLVFQLAFAFNSFADVNSCLKLSITETNDYLDLKPHLKDIFVEAYSGPGILVSVNLKPHLKNYDAPNIVSLDPGLIVRNNGKGSAEKVSLNSSTTFVYYNELNFYVCKSKKKSWDYDAKGEVVEDGRGVVLKVGLKDLIKSAGDDDDSKKNIIKTAVTSYGVSDPDYDDESLIIDDCKNGLKKDKSVPSDDIEVKNPSCFGI